MRYRSKSMLMVTASGTAVRAQRLSESSSVLDVTTPVAISGKDLQTALTRRRLVRQAETEALNLGDADTWDFILDHGLPEIAQYVLLKTRGLLGSSYNVNEQAPATEKYREYFLSLSPEVAKENLYKCVDSNVGMWRFVYSIIRDGNLFDSTKIRESLGSESLTAKKRCVSLAAVDAPEYTADDIDDLESLADEIDSAFDGASSYSKKGIFGEKELWKCECGQEVRAEEERCTSCTRDRFGFGEGMLRPDQAASLLREKASVLRSTFQIPSKRSDPTDELALT
jgi:hypothetical protein